MNFMEKFNELANRTLVPIANKLGNQRHLAAIRDGMVVAIPLSILGGVCLIISTPPFKPETLPNWGFVSDMLNGWYNWAQANKAMLQLPYNMTMALMGLFIAFAIAYHLADEYEMPKLNSAIVSTAVFLIVSAPTTSAVASNLIVDGKSATDLLALAGNYIPTTYLDAKGIFTAILVALLCAASLAATLTACTNKPTQEEVEQAIADGSVTVEDAVEKGWVTQEWAEEYQESLSVPAIDKVAYHAIGEFMTQTMSGEEFTRDDVADVTFLPLLILPAQKQRIIIMKL